MLCQWLEDESESGFEGLKGSHPDQKYCVMVGRQLNDSWFRVSLFSPFLIFCFSVPTLNSMAHYRSPYKYERLNRDASQCQCPNYCTHEW